MIFLDSKSRCLSEYRMTLWLTLTLSLALALPSMAAAQTSPPQFAEGVITQRSRAQVPAFDQGVYSESVPYRTVYTMPTLDNQALREQDALRGWNNRYAVFRPAPGLWSQAGTAFLRDGAQVTTVGIHSANASALTLHLQDLRLPDGGEIYFYTATAVHGPVTMDHLKGKNSYLLPPLPGELGYLEVYLPPSSPFPGYLQVNVGHGYHAEDPDACYIDVACRPDRLPLADSVGEIHTDGGFLCSGTLINGAYDFSLFLTAEHCLFDGPDFYFPYLKSSPFPNKPLTAEDSWTEYGSDLTIVFYHRDEACHQDSVAELSYPIFVDDLVQYHAHETDIALLKLTDEGQAIDPRCVPQAGWDVSEDTPAATYGVSHPAGWGQKTVAQPSPPQKASYEDDDEDVQAAFVETNTFWEISLHHGDGEGDMTGGASGSPLVNPSRRIVGQLSGSLGSTQSCGSGKFFYGRLSRTREIDPSIMAILGDSLTEDGTGNRTLNPFPLQGSLSGCHGSYQVTINHQVPPDMLIDWYVDGDAALVAVSLDRRTATIAVGTLGTSYRVRIKVTNPAETCQRTETYVSPDVPVGCVTL